MLLAEDGQRSSSFVEAVHVMNRVFLFFLLSWLLHNPVLALIIVAALSLPGYLYASGWMFRLLRRVRHWQETQRLRETVAVNPHNVAAQTDLGRDREQWSLPITIA